MITLGVDGVTLDQLWNTDLSDLKDRCFLDGTRANPIHFDDYCAINLSDRLLQAGFRMPNKASSPYRQCHSHRDTSEQHEFHFLLAEQMANWLLTKPIAGLPDVQRSTGEEFEDAFNDKQGIIFFKDYWRESGQSYEERSGDHIDVWRNGRMPAASNVSRELAELFGAVTHLEYSREVWLWELP